VLILFHSIYFNTLSFFLDSSKKSLKKCHKNRRWKKENKINWMRSVHLLTFNFKIILTHMSKDLKKKQKMTWIFLTR